MFFLIMVRIIGVFIQAPVFGSRLIPPQGLIGLAALLSIVIYPQIQVPANFPTDVVGFVQVLALQFLVGSVIGYIANMVIAGAQFAGTILDVQLGLSAAAVYDPSMGGSVNILNRFQYYFALLLWLAIGGHHILIRAIQESFNIVPLTGMSYSGPLMGEFIRLTGQIFYIGIQVAAPMLAALFIIQVALGLLSRVAPQMNVFMLSFPLNIMIGTIMLLLSLGFIKLALTNLFDKNFFDIMNAIKIMK
ncbi:MAG: flagellar biosynthetic protein FliR [Armatimonadota bacterium]